MIKIGILGAGRVVQNRYVDVFLNELQDARVAMVCDPVFSKAEKVAAELGATPVKDMEDVINSGDLDLVLVATESGNHYDHSLQALRSGKHVVTEKPPAMFPEQVLELEKLAREKGLMYAVIFQNRYNPAMVGLKAAMDDGRFGKLVTASIRLLWCRYQDYYEDGWHGTWRMDGGVINQQAIHHADALQWTCGPIRKVCAAQSNALNSLEAEDTMAAVVEFENGALGTIEVTTAARPEDFEASISVVGEKGMVVVGGVALNRVDEWSFVEKKDVDADAAARFSQEVPTGYGLSHGPLMQDIVDRLNRGEIVPPMSGSDTVQTVRLVHALYKSIEIGGWVELSASPLSSRLGH